MIEGTPGILRLVSQLVLAWIKNFDIQMTPMVVRAAA